MLGLILAGGKGKRMNREKSGIVVRGQSLLSWQQQWLQPLVDEVVVSGPFELISTGYEIVTDLIENTGPLAGVLSVQKRHPNMPLFLMPVDLFFFNPTILGQLKNERDPSQAGTIFYNEERNEPEPLMGIYEPGTALLLENFLNSGHRSATKFVVENEFKMVPIKPDWVNLNRPEDLEILLNRLSGK